jgi:hypothetical protein
MEADPLGGAELAVADEDVSPAVREDGRAGITVGTTRREIVVG